MFGYIYVTVNKVNGKRYIGQHKATEFEGTKYLGSGKILHQAIEKYGVENFTVEMLCECSSREELNKMEEFYIEKYNAQKSTDYYNIRRGGERGPGGPMFQGHKHTEETKQKMREQRKGKGNANYGNRWHQSDELKAKHSKLSAGKNNGMYGKKHSDETKRLIGAKNSIALKGRKCISKDGRRKFVRPCDLDEYLNNGWRLGYSTKHINTKE